MEYRNAKYTQDGKIDCEINHPKYGWIPFTASQDDVEAVSREVFNSAKSTAGPYVPPPEPTAEELLERERANTSLPKDDFILACLDAGVLTEADAEQATSGWPTGWDAFFEGKPARERIEAKARWANATNVYRNAPLIEALAAFNGLSPEQVDALFGVEV